MRLVPSFQLLLSELCAIKKAFPSLIGGWNKYMFVLPETHLLCVVGKKKATTEMRSAFQQQKSGSGSAAARTNKAGSKNYFAKTNQRWSAAGSTIDSFQNVAHFIYKIRFDDRLILRLWNCERVGREEQVFYCLSCFSRVLERIQRQHSGQA